MQKEDNEAVEKEGITAAGEESSEDSEAAEGEAGEAVESAGSHNDGDKKILFLYKTWDGFRTVRKGELPKFSKAARPAAKRLTELPSMISIMICTTSSDP